MRRRILPSDATEAAVHALEERPRLINALHRTQDRIRLLLKKIEYMNILLEAKKHEEVEIKGFSGHG